MALDNKTSILDLVNTTNEVSEVINTAIPDKTLGIANTDLSNITNNANATILHQSLPSEKFINLTFGANGSTFTAPADGYLQWVKVATSSGQTIGLAYINTAEGKWYDGKSCSDHVNIQWSHSNGQILAMLEPLRKGKTYIYYYSAAGELAAFRFIYAEGSKHET